MATPRMAGYGLNQSLSLDDMRKQEQIRQLQQSQERVRARGTGQAPTTWGESAAILSNQVNEATGWTSEAKNRQEEERLQSSIPNPYNTAQRQVSPGEQAGIDFRTAQGPMTGYGKNPIPWTPIQPAMSQYAQQAQAEQEKAKRPISEMVAQMENESFPKPGDPPLQVQQGSNPAPGTISVTKVEDFSTPGDTAAASAPMQTGAAGITTPGTPTPMEAAAPMQSGASIVDTTVPVQSAPMSAGGVNPGPMPDVGGMTPSGSTSPNWSSTNALSGANTANMQDGPAPPLVDPKKPTSPFLTALSGYGAGSTTAGPSTSTGLEGTGLSGYGGVKPNYPPPASSTASAPNSVWTGADTNRVAQSAFTMPQSYVGAPTAGSSFGGVGGYGGGGGYSAPQFNAPSAPSFGGGGDAAGGGAGSAPVAPQFTGQQPSSSSSSSSSSQQSSSGSGSMGGPQLPPEKQAALEKEALAQWQAGQDALAADKAAEATASSTGTTPTTTDSTAEIGKIAEDYQKAQDSANKANEDRYAKGMAGYGDRYDRNMATEATRTNQDYEDLDRAEKAALASNQQSLTNRGLGNSTIVDTTRKGIVDQYAALRNRLGDSRIAQKTSLDAGLSGDLLKFLENRTDSSPDYQQLLAIAQLIGQRPTVAR